MKYRNLISSAIIAGGVALSGASFAVTPSAEILGYSCAGCHGTNGVSAGPATPSLAGMPSEYFMDSMKAYNDGSRPNTIMTRVAKGYTEEEYQLMAGFFAKQKFAATKQSFDAGAAKAGAKLHDKYCEKCHEDGGKLGDESESNSLAGQPMPYLTWTMEDYNNGSREMGKKMKKKMKKLHQKAGDEGIQQLLHYYASQQ